MTEIQLKYQNHLENVQHNRNTEQQAVNELNETVRSNKAREGENLRHNLQTEGETVRHNMVTESQTDRSIGETVRSNKARESIQRDTLSETKRANRANEDIKKETNRIADSKAVAEIAERVSKTKLNEFNSSLRSRFPDLFVAQELGKAGGDLTDDIAGMLAIASTGTGYISEIASSLGIDLSDKAIKDAITAAGKKLGIVASKNQSSKSATLSKKASKASKKLGNIGNELESAGKAIVQFFRDNPIRPVDH